MVELNKNDIKYLKQVTSEELENYINSLASEHFNKPYYGTFKDYVEDFREQETNNGVTRVRIELSEPKKEPLVIEFFEKIIFDNDDDIVDIQYYI